MSFYVTDRQGMPTLQAVIRWRAPSLWTAHRAGDVVMRQRIVLGPDYQNINFLHPADQGFPLAVECVFGARNGREQEVEMRLWAQLDLGILAAVGTRVVLLRRNSATAEGKVV